MTDTLLLDRDTWDLTLDSQGNVALATEPYSLVQDVASACRLFLGELYYDTSKGVRYFEQILGKPAPLAILKAQLVAAALTVRGVASATVFLSGVTGRGVTGQVQCVLESGGVAIVPL